MKAHGQFDIKVQHKTLYIKVTGEFNVQGYEDTLQDVKNTVLKHEFSEFAVLVDLADWGLGEPGAKDIFERFRPWFIEHGQKYEALVVGQSHLKKLEMLSFLPDFDDQLSSKFCASVEDAEAWLKQKGML